MMKKLLSFTFVAILLLTLLVPCVSAEAEKDYSHLKGTTLNVYNWGEYISDGSDDTLDVNAEFENHKQVKAYIKTVKRANIPSNLDLFTKYDKTAKRMKPSKNDFTVEAADYVSVSIYNKYAQMTKEKIGVFPEKEIERAKNIVRIEIRCMEGKIKVLQKK